MTFAKGFFIWRINLNNIKTTLSGSNIVDIVIYGTNMDLFYLAHRPLKVNVHADGEINKPIDMPIHAHL